MKIVDLTQKMTMASFKRLCRLNSHAARSSSKFRGTYVEAPALVRKTESAIGEIDVSSFYRDAVRLDLGEKKARDPIDDEDLEAAEEASGLAVREGEFVIVQTGWERMVNRAYFSAHPGLSENGAQYLGFKRVCGVGIDTPCLDVPGVRRLPAHRTLFESGCIIIENLCNLGRINQGRFNLVALPLRVDAAWSPARVVALL